MSKDDYYVIVYQILSYLYQRLKNGEDINPVMLRHDSPILRINERYWAYVIYNMSRYNLIEGVTFIDIDGLDIPYAANIEKCMITPVGIEYLCENTLIEKAKRFLKDTKEIVPFI